MQTGTLLLNASYEPLAVSPIRRTISHVQRGIVEVLESDPTRMIRSGRQEMPYPIVIRLKKHVKIPPKLRGRVSNTILFARDNYECQYCGKTEEQLGPRNGFSRDHVIPKSRGGQDIWTNVVTACSPCNSRKDNKTPAEARMTLRKQPHVPHIIQLKWKIRRLTEMQAKYISMFYGDNWQLAVEQ